MSEPLDPTIAEAINRGLNRSAELILEARLVGAFDALYAAGGIPLGLRIITILTERLAEQARADLARSLISDHEGWIG